MPNNPYTSAQAPQSMQLLAPDLAAQQNQLARQQQMAEMLRQNGMQEDGPTEVVSGWAVPKGRLQPLAKLAQAVMGGRMQQGIDDKQAAIAKALQERQVSAFNDMAGIGLSKGQPASPNAAQPGVPGPQQTQTVDPMQVTEGGIAQSNQPTPQPAMQAPAPQQMSQIEILQNQARAAWINGNKELANKIIENISLMTEGQRNDNYLGISADQSREAELAKRTKEGTMSYQPGQLNVLPNGQKIVAPNFETGVAGGFDSQGNPVASEIKGSTQIAAKRAGAVTEATAQANAGQRMTTVMIGGRPVMMTEAQAVQMANNGTAPTGTQFNNPAPGGMSLDFKGDPQAVFNQISQIKDPAIRAQAMQALGQMPAPSSNIGIAGLTDAEKEKEVGQVRNSLSIDKSRIESAQSQDNQQKLIDSKSTLGLLDEIDSLLAKGAATGSKGGVMRDELTGAFGVSTEASKDAAQLKLLGGSLVSKVPKMSGPQSDKDVAMYKEMAGRLGDPNIPIGDRVAASKVMRRLQEKYGAENEGSIANEALNRNKGTPLQQSQAAPTSSKPKFKYLGKD